MLILEGSNAYSGGTTVSNGTLRLRGANAAIAGDVLNNSSFEFHRGNDIVFDGVVSGTGSVTVKSGVERFSQAQTYTGTTTTTTTIESGGVMVLSTTIGQGLSAATTVDVQSGGIFDFSNTALTIAGLTGGGDVYSFGGSNGHLTLNIGTGETSTFTGTLGSSFPNFALTKTGLGTQFLSGANDFTGSTTVSGGTPSIAADTALGVVPGAATAGHLTLDGGTLATTADFAVNANRGVSLGASGGTFDTAGATSLTYGASSLVRGLSLSPAPATSLSRESTLSPATPP